MLAGKHVPLRLVMESELHAQACKDASCTVHAGGSTSSWRRARPTSVSARRRSRTAARRCLAAAAPCMAAASTRQAPHFLSLLTVQAVSCPYLGTCTPPCTIHKEFSCTE